MATTSTSTKMNFLFGTARPSSPKGPEDLLINAAEMRQLLATQPAYLEELIHQISTTGALKISNPQLSSSGLAVLLDRLFIDRPALLQHLTAMIITGCQLKQLPANFMKYFQTISNQLDLLDLSHNQLQELPLTFGCLKIPGSIDLSHNQLSFVPDSFFLLKVGKDINLSNNLLRYFSGRYTDLVTQDLILSLNPLQKIPTRADFPFIQKVVFQQAADRVHFSSQPKLKPIARGSMHPTTPPTDAAAAMTSQMKLTPLKIGPKQKPISDSSLSSLRIELNKSLEFFKCELQKLQELQKL